MAEQHAFKQQSRPEGVAHAPMDATLPAAKLLSLSNNDMLAAYLREVRAQHRLSADEEQHLVAQLTTGRAARQQLHDTMLAADQQATLRETIAVAEAARQRL